MTDSVPHMALLHRVLISHVRTLDTIFFKLAGSECIISSNSANFTEEKENLVPSSTTFLLTIIVIFFHYNIKETYLARAKKDFGKTKLVILVVHPESVKQSLQQ